jgi:hypothetical protein
MSPDQLSEQAMADLLYRTVSRHREDQIWNQMRVWLHDLGKNVRDEQAQFRVLQKACRVSPELADSMRAAGLGEAIDGDLFQPSPLKGAVIQGFNRMVEQHLEHW